MGRRAIVAKAWEVPLVSMKLVLDGGDAADPKALAGRGDMAAALALKGADGRSAEAIASDIAALGGTISASSEPDATLFSVNVPARSEEHTSELQSLMRISYAVSCLQKKNKK